MTKTAIPIIWTLVALFVLFASPGLFLFAIILLVDPSRVSAELGIVLIFSEILAVFLGILFFSLIMRHVIRIKTEQSAEE